MCLRFMFSGKADYTILSSQKGRLDQGTGMTRIATVADDDELLVRLCSI